MKITIRYRHRDSSTSFVYLDIRDGEKSRKQSVKGVFVYSSKRLTKEQKEHNNQVMTIAEKAKSDLLAVDPSHGSSFSMETMTRMYLDNKCSSENTIKSFMQMLSRIDGRVKAEDITTEVINEQYAKINSSELSNNSKLLYRSKLDAVIRYGIKKGFIKAGVLDRVDDKIRAKSHTREYLTKEELKGMIQEYRDSHKNWLRVFLFSCFTGLRYSDLKLLTWDNITDDHVIRLQTKKTDSSVIVPLNDNAKSLLPRRDKGNVFEVPDVSSIRKNLLLYASKNGINKNISFHTARHTFATLSVMANVDIYTISRLLGHNSIKTTQIYADMVDARRKDAVDKLNDILK